LDGNRWLRLAVYAQAHGFLDYATLDPREPSHVAHERLILREVEKTCSVELFKLRHEMHAGASSRHPEWDRDSKIARYHLSEALEAYTDVGKVLLPYLDWSSKESSTIKGDNYTIEEYKKAWEDAFGRIDDPTTQERIKEVVEECEKPPDSTIPDTARFFGGAL
jgi:hypothetical protein